MERGRFNKDALLLNGPQHWDPARLWSHHARKLFEHADPLGNAIIGAILKRDFGFTAHMAVMKPGSVDTLEQAIEQAGVVIISSRNYDISLSEKATEIANRLGKPTIVGGYGPTFSPENFSHASTRVLGEAEPVIYEVIDDLLSGSLQASYDSRSLPPFDIRNHYIWPDRSLLPRFRGPLTKFYKHSQEWQRGCTNYCTFCSPTRLQRAEIKDNQRFVRTRQVDDIINEIEQSMHLKPGDNLFSLDLNSSAIPPDELKGLFTYLKQSGIRWYTEGTVLPLLQDIEAFGEQGSLLSLMSPKDSLGGCYSFLYGVDDMVSERVRGSQDKDIRLLHQAVDLFRKMGIPLNLSVVVGLDHHRYPESFFQIWELLEEVNAPFAFIHIATPYPGTVWGGMVSREERIFDFESTHYNHRKVVMEPKLMTREELQQGYYWLLRHQSTPASLSRIARANLDPHQLVKNPTLAVIQSGLLWGIETYISGLELSARNYINWDIQNELDLEYRIWKSQGHQEQDG